MNPKAATRYRDRKAPAGAKDDELDAWSFADALRTDGHGWRELAAQDPLTAELRLLCRDEVKLISQRTALVNQLTMVVAGGGGAGHGAVGFGSVPYCWIGNRHVPRTGAFHGGSVRLSSGWHPRMHVI